MTRDELREKIAKLLWERFGFPECQAAWHSTGLDVADRILALFPGLIELSAENAHLRQRCTWLQERRAVLRKLVASRWSKRREVRRLRARLAAGPVMPAVPSESIIKKAAAIRISIGGVVGHEMPLGTDLTEAARATRKYFVSWHGLIKAKVWGVYPQDLFDPYSGELVAEIDHLSSEDEAQAACDRLNLVAVLEAIRDPSEGVVEAALNYLASTAEGSMSSLWRAMIDALIAEVSNDQR